MSWDIPTGEKCETCGGAMVKVGKIVKCSNKDCKGKKPSRSWAMQEPIDLPPAMEEPPIYDDYYGQED